MSAEAIGKKGGAPERAAFAAALSDPNADIARLNSAKEKLSRRLWHYNQGTFAGTLAGSLSDEEIRAASAKQKIWLAALCAEAGFVRKAARLVDQAGAGAFEQYRRPGLVLALADFRPQLTAPYQAEIARAKAYMDGLGGFARLVQDNRGGVAVVGNAPCEIGKKRGAEIDARGLVIRFNNFSEAPEVIPDYGGKTDVWVRAPTYLRAWRRYGRRFQLMMFGRPILWRVEHGVEALADIAMIGAAADEMPARLYAELQIALGAPPSAGIAILYWIRHCLGSLDGVLVAGFDPASQSAGLKKYFDHLPLNAEPPHNWAAEAQMLEEMIAGAPLSRAKA